MYEILNTNTDESNFFKSTAATIRFLENTFYAQLGNCLIFTRVNLNLLKRTDINSRKAMYNLALKITHIHESFSSQVSHVHVSVHKLPSKLMGFHINMLLQNEEK